MSEPKHDSGEAVKRAAEVVGTQIVMDNHAEERIRDLEVDVAVHGQNLSDLRETTEGLRADLRVVSDKLTSAVEALVDRVNRFEKIAIVGTLIIFAGTSHGGQVLQWIGQVFK